jgi:hypothetical protein
MIRKTNGFKSFLTKRQVVLLAPLGAFCSLALQRRARRTPKRWEVAKNLCSWFDQTQEQTEIRALLPTGPSFPVTWRPQRRVD